MAIGREILSHQKLLLFDEPAEEIQPFIVDQIEEAIIGFKNQRHFAARLADAYVIMAKGAVVAAGKTSELSAEEVRRHLVV